MRAHKAGFLPPCDNRHKVIVYLQMFECEGNQCPVQTWWNDVNGGLHAEVYVWLSLSTLPGLALVSLPGCWKSLCPVVPIGFFCLEQLKEKFEKSALKSCSSVNLTHLERRVKEKACFPRGKDTGGGSAACQCTGSGGHSMALTCPLRPPQRWQKKQAFPTLCEEY